MLGKMLVGLIAAAAIAVGGYYYFSSGPDQTAGPNCALTAGNPGELNTCCEEAPPCCANPSRAQSIAVSSCCEAGHEGAVEFVSIQPREAQTEVAPLPREQSAAQ